MDRYCEYYQATIKPELCWMVSIALRGTEHVAFDRTLDAKAGVWEFYVPQSTQHIFIQVMDYLKKEFVVTSYQKLENRLKTEEI